MGIGIVKEEIARCLDGEGITRERIKIEIAQIAFGADLADVEPYLNGEKSLVELREEGFDTRLVKSASVTPNLHGTARKVELHDRLAALEKLARIRKLVDGDSAPPIVATVRIDVLTTLTAMLNRMEAAIPEGSDCLTVPLLEGEVLSARVIEVEEPDDD